MRKTEPSKDSLRDIPELDLTAMRRLSRGKYAAKARRSFAVALVEPKIFAHFGSSEAVNAALKALVDAAGAMKHPSSVRSRPRSGNKKKAA